MDNVATITATTGSAHFSVGEYEQPLKTGGSVPAGAAVATSAGAHAEVAFTDGTIISLGEFSSFIIQNFSFQPSLPDQWGLDLHIDHGTFRITSGNIASNESQGIRVSSNTASIQMDEHGGDIVVRDGLTQVGSVMGSAPHLSVTTALGTATITTPGSIMDILAGGRIGGIRQYTDFERAYFKAAAPLSEEATHEVIEAEVIDTGADQTHDDYAELSTSDFGTTYIDFEESDHQELLTLFETYFGTNGTTNGIAVTLFQGMDDGLSTTSGLDHDAVIATAEAPLPPADESPQDQTRSLYNYAQDFFEDHGSDIASLFARWFGGGSRTETEVAEKSSSEEETPSHVNSNAELDRSPDITLAAATHGDGTEAELAPQPQSVPTSSTDQDSADSNTMFPNSIVQNMVPANSPFDSGSTTLIGGGVSDDLTQAPANPYDDWSSSPLDSETTTTDTHIFTPHYSLGIVYHTIRCGWFTIHIPIPVIRVEYSEQLISSETTTTTLYEDGATETQTMLDTDADGHWNQSSSNLLYADGTQRSVSLFDVDDDGTWDTYETTLIYQDGTTASSHAGDYAEAPDEILHHLALATDDPSAA
ncbi:hypothetical protein [Desulfovibrio ferrophilus]|uniref:Cadherin n=1 Tax=Desulfovibrio ferrophilus TaxID=241368 RepID=A0A2Z6AUN0_9BACT|nr:hypothetical protein [Desulfovibrio ferrophilus]BBD06939.1 cadherin [Desulfovibrio ferrophilus]